MKTYLTVDLKLILVFLLSVGCY